MGDNQGAIDDYNQALKINPSHAYAAYSTGLARSALDKQGAIDDYNQALRIDPNSMQAYKNRPTIPYKKIALTLIEAVFLGILAASVIIFANNFNSRKNSNLEKDYVKRCSLYFSLKDYSEAVDDCNEAIKINPDNDEAYFLRGASHIMNGNKSQGMEDLRKAISLGNEKAREILKDVK